MGKVLIIVVGLAAVGALAWALMSPSGSGTAPAAAPASTAAAAAPSAARDKAPEPDDAPTAPVRRPPPVVHGALPPRPIQVGGGAAPAAAMDGAPPEAPKMPSAALTDVQSTVRAYHGNLPRSGKIPARITLDEVLPPDVIRQIGATGSAKLVMLGTWNADDERAFTDVLAMEGRYQEMLGVSWLDDQGVEQRNYVQLTVPAQPAE